MNYKRLAAALIFAGALTGAAAAARNNPTVFTKPGAIAVKADDEFLIALEANPSTGYSWSPKISAPDVLSYRGSSYRGRAKMPPGAGGEQLLSFAAKRTGHATITLSYARPWEKNVKPAKMLIFSVSVTK